MDKDKPDSEADEGSDHSSVDEQAMGVDSGGQGQVTNVDFPSRINTMKPKITISSGIQKQLPDFESFGNQSDEPTFHPHVTGSRDVLDDDKDLCTSPRPDYSHGSPKNLPSQSPEKNVSAVVMEGDTALFDNDLAAFRSTMASFTEDVIQIWKRMMQKMADPLSELKMREAADLRSRELRRTSEAESTKKLSVMQGVQWYRVVQKMEDSSFEETQEAADLRRARALRRRSIAESTKKSSVIQGADWFRLVQKMENSSFEETQEAADLRRARVLRHATEKSTENLSVTQDTADEAKTNETSDSKNFRIEDSNNIKAAGEPVDKPLVPETVKKVRFRLQEGLKTTDLGEPQTTFAEKARSRVNDIMSRFRFQEQRNLSREHFEELNLNSVLDATHEENNPMSLQIPSQSSGQKSRSPIRSGDEETIIDSVLDATREENNPMSLQIPSQSSGQKSRSPIGSGDEETIIDVPEEVTLIQKLTNLTIKIGDDVEALRSLDPHTGAATSPGLQADKSLISVNQNIADGSHISEASCQASDSILDATREEENPMSLQIPSPSSGQKSRSPNGSGDEETIIDSVLDATCEEKNPMSLQIPSQSSGQKSRSPIGSGDEETIIDSVLDAICEEENPMSLQIPSQSSGQKSRSPIGSGDVETIIDSVLDATREEENPVSLQIPSQSSGQKSRSPIGSGDEETIIDSVLDATCEEENPMSLQISSQSSGQKSRSPIGSGDVETIIDSVLDATREEENPVSLQIPSQSSGQKSRSPIGSGDEETIIYSVLDATCEEENPMSLQISSQSSGQKSRSPIGSGDVETIIDSVLDATCEEENPMSLQIPSQSSGQKSRSPIGSGDVETIIDSVLDATCEEENPMSLQIPSQSSGQKSRSPIGSGDEETIIDSVLDATCEEENPLSLQIPSPSSGQKSRSPIGSGDEETIIDSVLNATCEEENPLSLQIPSQSSGQKSRSPIGSGDEETIIDSVLDATCEEENPMSLQIPCQSSGQKSRSPIGSGDEETIIDSVLDATCEEENPVSLQIPSLSSGQKSRSPIGSGDEETIIDSVLNATCEEENPMSLQIPSQSSGQKSRSPIGSGDEETIIDSVLDATCEEENPMSLQIPGQSSGQKSRSSVGSGDEETIIDAPEEPTLMQKLESLTIEIEEDMETLRSIIDPDTGAATARPGLRADKSLISDNQNVADGSQISAAGCQAAEEVDSFDIEALERIIETKMQALEAAHILLTMPEGQSNESFSSDEEMVNRTERNDFTMIRQQAIDFINAEWRKSVASAHGASVSKEDNVHDTSGTKEDLVCIKTESKKDQAHRLYPADIKRQYNETEQPYLKDPLEVSTVQKSREMESSLQATQALTPQMASYEEVCQTEDKPKKKKRTRKGKSQNKDDDYPQKKREVVKRTEEMEREIRLRQEIRKQIEDARSTASTQGKQAAAENTPSLFEKDITFELPPLPLPRELESDRETLLLTVSLSCNSRVLQHRNKLGQSIDTEEGVPITYNALLTYFLSHVPAESAAWTRPVSSQWSPDVSLPFYVIGLQQLFLNEELKLYVMVTPSETFSSRYSQYHYYKKGQVKRDAKGSSHFLNYLTKTLSTMTLNAFFPTGEICMPLSLKGLKPEYRDVEPYIYTPPSPRISTKPLSTFIQVNPDPQAGRKIFGIPLGFHWQTIDNDEVLCSADGCLDDDGSTTETALTLFFSHVYTKPVVMMSILCRMSEEGLDLAGIRLLYPSSDQINKRNGTPYQEDVLKKNSPVLALAIRGAHAVASWMTATGPPDQEAARDLLPKSINAMFGGNSGDPPIFYSPLREQYVQEELVRWFGGRAPRGNMPVSIGAPYLKKEEVKIKRGKKSNKGGNFMPVQRPPAALTATSRSDVFLIVSPLCPNNYLGVITCVFQGRGYVLRGVRRLRMTLKMAGTLGISEEWQKFFCPGVLFDDQNTDRSAEALSPVTVFMMANENAGHNVGSLIESIMGDLTVAGLLGVVAARIEGNLTSKQLFHATVYTDAFLAMFGGTMSQIPDVIDIPLHLKSYASMDDRDDEEQIAVVAVIGKRLIKCGGSYYARILNEQSFYLSKQLEAVGESFELLGIKCIPSLTLEQATVLSPYEAGHELYFSSTRAMKSEPAVVFVLRGLKIFVILTPFIQKLHKEIELRDNQQRLDGGAMTSPQMQLVVPYGPKNTDILVRLLFSENELYPDPKQRELLFYLHESRLYLHVLPIEKDGHTRRIVVLKKFDEIDLTKENIMEALVGQPEIVTLLIVKPQAVARHLTAILKKAVEEQFTIIGLRMLMLSAETATELIPVIYRENASKFRSHLRAFTCGPAVAVALQRSNAVKKLLDLVGPPNSILAKSQNSSYWRAQFGTDEFNNGIFCSINYISAVKELKILFPDGLCCLANKILESDKILAPGVDSLIDINANTRVIIETFDPREAVADQDDVRHLVQTTCVAINPRMMNVNLRSKKVAALTIMEWFLDSGFKIVGCRLVCLTKEQVLGLISLMKFKEYTSLDLLLSGPLLVLAVERENAFVNFKSLLSPDKDSRMLMDLYGDEWIEPQDTKQVITLLKFFFDRLMPDSQLTVSSVREGGDELEFDGADDDEEDDEGEVVREENGDEGQCVQLVGVELVGVEGAGVEGAGVEGAGVEGAGVEGAGVEGAGVVGLGFELVGVEIVGVELVDVGGAGFGEVGVGGVVVRGTVVGGAGGRIQGAEEGVEWEEVAWGEVYSGEDGEWEIDFGESDDGGDSDYEGESDGTGEGDGDAREGGGDAREGGGDAGEGGGDAGEGGGDAGEGGGDAGEGGGDAGEGDCCGDPEDGVGDAGEGGGEAVEAGGSGNKEDDGAENVGADTGNEETDEAEEAADYSDEEAAAAAETLLSVWV